MSLYVTLEYPKYTRKPRVILKTSTESIESDIAALGQEFRLQHVQTDINGHRCYTVLGKRR